MLFLLVFRFLRLLLSGHQAVALENAALRMQIAAFQRKRKRPLLSTLAGPEITAGVVVPSTFCALAGAGAVPTT